MKMTTIDIELEMDVIAGLAIIAHERDITLNQLIVDILEEFVKENTNDTCS